MSSIPNDRWQSRVTNIQSAICEIWRTKEFSDVTIQINKQDPIKAHKFVLGARSPVFKEKFLDSAYDEVTFEDESITSLGFDILLCFIYTNKITTEDKVLTIQVYQAATFFEQTELCKECEKRFELWTITKDDVWELLDASLSILLLRNKCITFIKNNVEEALLSPSFLTISYGCLDTLLERGVLRNASVMLCFKRIMEWAVNRHTKPVDYELVRDSFNSKTFGKLGFEAFNKEELNIIMKDYKGLLTAKEAAQFILYSGSKDVTHLPCWCIPSS